MALFKPTEGSCYKKEEIVLLCKQYIYSPAFQGNKTEKEQKVSLIEKKPGGFLLFQSRGKGWGSSAMNPNCWIPVNDQKIFENKEDSKKDNNNRKNMDHHLTEPEPVKVQIHTDKVADVTLTDSQAQYNQRPWQGNYRNELLRIWGVCAVTGCRTPSLLTASHIKPVIHCTDQEKVDPYNGILLSKVYDSLFDRGLISFEDDGKIMISESIPKEDLEALHINENIKIRLDSRQLPYLRFHRDKIFK